MLSFSLKNDMCLRDKSKNKKVVYCRYTESEVYISLRAKALRPKETPFLSAESFCSKRYRYLTCVLRIPAVRQHFTSPFVFEHCMPICSR